MNDIEILEEFIKYFEAEATARKYRRNITITVGEDDIEAIENLIQENKELKEENNKLKTCDGILDVFSLGKESSRQRIKFDWVEKSKIKEKIEELEKERKRKDEEDIINPFYDQIDITHIIEVLQELLED